MNHAEQAKINLKRLLFISRFLRILGSFGESNHELPVLKRQVELAPITQPYLARTSSGSQRRYLEWKEIQTMEEELKSRDAPLIVRRMGRALALSMTCHHLAMIYIQQMRGSQFKTMKT